MYAYVNGELSQLTEDDSWVREGRGASGSKNGRYVDKGGLVAPIVLQAKLRRLNVRVMSGTSVNSTKERESCCT